jgi:lipopolysaccharide transport system permease protein
MPTQQPVEAPTSHAASPPALDTEDARSGVFRWGLLLRELTRREFKGRYSSARLGLAWAILNPLLQAAVFTAVFSKVLHVASEGFPYPVWALTGLLSWQTFRSAVMAATSSMLDDRSVIKRVPFPRWLLPLAIVLANGINFVLTVPIVLILMVAWGCPVPATAILFVLPVLHVCLLAIGVGLITSALTVFYRDVRHLLEPLLLLWFYASPIFYPAEAVPARWRPIYDLNPAVGVIELTRGILLKGSIEMGASLVSSLVIPVALIAAGAWAYRRYAPRFVDML